VDSVSSYIAASASRSNESEFRRFLGITIGSAFEIETQLMIIERNSRDALW